MNVRQSRFAGTFTYQPDFYGVQPEQVGFEVLPQPLADTFKQRIVDSKAIRTGAISYRHVEGDYATMATGTIALDAFDGDTFAREFKASSWGGRIDGVTDALSQALGFITLKEGQCPDSMLDRIQDIVDKPRRSPEEDGFLAKLHQLLSG